MYWEYPRYVSAAEKKAKAAKKLKQLKKKMPNIRPVAIEGNALAHTWWGKSWNKNLESYADYSNRIGRGRSYVRHGAVLDLQIQQGKVSALVQGSTAQPYEVQIGIKKISKINWYRIKKQCESKLPSLQDLLAGKFPKALGELFLTKGDGLFPGPREISFSCSCPDFASMCKHVAAALYGIGARLDREPSLFFTLRNIDTAELAAKAINDTKSKIFAKTKKKSSKVMDDSNLSELFGIDMESRSDLAQNKVKKTTIAKTTPRKKETNIQVRKSKTAIDTVADLIFQSISGINIENLAKKTGYSKTKVYGLIYRLKQQGKIKNVTYGVYIKT